MRVTVTYNELACLLISKIKALQDDSSLDSQAFNTDSYNRAQAVAALTYLVEQDDDFYGDAILYTQSEGR